MSRHYVGGNPQPIYLPLWYYLGEETIDGNDAAQTLNFPTPKTQIVEMRPEGGAMYFSINGTAQASSGGYIPEDGAEIIGPIANLTSVSVWAETGTTIHVIYFRENVVE